MKRRNLLSGLALVLVCTVITATGNAAESNEPLRLNLRMRVETAPDSGRYHAITKPAEWDARKTAIVICDMWDDHYCRSSARRVAEMAPRMNEVIKRAREQGVLIIHCPSGCMDKYEATPQRKLAQQAPKVEAKVPLKNWCYLDDKHEPPLPVVDSVPCDDETPRERVRFYTRQIETLEIQPGDAVTDSAEAYYLMRQRGIDNVIVMGVHTNMCVLGRPFGIRQLVYQGQNVVLMRDMTDSMYDPRQAPYVSHFTGNDLIVEHVERHWCPTITSADFLGGKPFRFQEDQRPHLAIVMSEDEYRTEQSLPAFAAKHLGKDFRVSLVFGSTKDLNDFPGLEVLNDADVAFWSIRRRTPPTEQMALFRKFIADGKPLVAIRTTSHAFCLRDKPPAAGYAEWPEFDRQVLGGFYHNHHGNELKTRVSAAPAAKDHPILTGVRADEFAVFGSLYKSLPLAETATPLLIGRIEADVPHEPVAWTNKTAAGGRVFYTSLGHIDDFQIPDFERLLLNGIYWTAGLPSPPAAAEAAR
jgi:nicotinamidase-related amidase